MYLYLRTINLFFLFLVCMYVILYRPIVFPRPPLVSFIYEPLSHSARTNLVRSLVNGNVVIIDKWINQSIYTYFFSSHLIVSFLSFLFFYWCIATTIGGRGALFDGALSIDLFPDIQEIRPSIFSGIYVSNISISISLSYNNY